MIDIVGNIKVDESKPERIVYLLSCIRSYAFLKDICQFHLHLEKPSQEVFGIVNDELERCGYRYVLTTANFPNYGAAYSFLLKINPASQYIINFMEDQFMVIDDVDKFVGVLKNMEKTKADVCSCGFFHVEQKSSLHLTEYFNTPVGITYVNSMENYTNYQKYYGSRYYIGVNFITTRGFAEKFWNRDAGHRPHEYEVCFYHQDWLHTVMLPRIEIQAAVDDDHGEINSCMLKRNEPKWDKIYNEILKEFNVENNPG